MRCTETSHDVSTKGCLNYAVTVLHTHDHQQSVHALHHRFRLVNPVHMYKNICHAKHPLLQFQDSAVRLPLCHAHILTTKLLTFCFLPPNIGTTARTGNIYLLSCDPAQSPHNLCCSPLVLALSASWLNTAASPAFLKALLRLYSRHMYRGSKAKHACQARKHTGGQTTGTQ